TALTTAVAATATATAATAAPTYCAPMASLRVLAFDHEGRPLQFDTWLDDLQLYLLSDSKDSVSLFDLASGAAIAPPATADSATRSQWLTRDAAARLAIRNHLPLTECAHFGQHKTAQDNTGQHSFPTVEDLVFHLRTSNARYRATVPAEDHFLSLDPTSLTVDLLEQHLLAAETSAVAVGAARGTPRPPFFEGCSPSPLAPSYASAATADVSVAEDVRAASASAKRRSSKGKGGKGGGGGSGGGGGGSESSGGGSSGGGGGGGTGGGSGGSGGGGGGSGGTGGSGGSGTGGGETGARRVGSGGGQRQQQQRRSETQSPQQLHLLRSRIAIFDLDYDAILSAMYALSVSAEGDCYQCVPPDLGIAAAALGASESGSSLYTLATEPPQVAASAPVSASGQVATSCLCRLLSHQNLLWHHCLGHPSLPRLRGMHSRLLVSGLPRSLPPLPPSPALPCLPCIEGRQRAAPHSSSFPPTTAPLQTLHMDVWVPACVSGQSRERYFLLLVDDYTRYTMVFPLRSKDQVVDILIPWIRTVRLQLRERFGQDLPVLHLHSDRVGKFSSNLLRNFCRGEGILQTFTLPDSPQQNGIAERRIGLVMETSPTLRWTGKVGDASVFRVWGSRAFVRDTSADKLSPRAIPCIFLGFVPDAPGWQFYHPTSRHGFPSQDVTFDESVPFYHLFPYRSAPPPPLPLFLASGLPPVNPLLPQEPAPSGVSQVDPLPGPAPVQVAVGSGAARGAASGGAVSWGAEPGGAESEGAGSGGAEPGGGEPGGAKPVGVEPEGAEPGGAESEGAESGGAEPRGAASSGGPADALPRLSLQQLRGWFVRHAHLRSGATGGRGTGDAGAGSAGVTAGAGGSGGTAATGPGGACTRGTRPARTGGVEGAGAGDPTEPGAAGAGGAGDTEWLRPYFLQLPLQPASPLPAPSPYTEQSGGLTQRREPASCPVSRVRTARRVPRSRPPPVLGTHAVALRPSSVPLRVPLPPPPESSLPEVPDPESDRARAANPTVARLLTTAVSDPSFECAAASALVAELLGFAAACCLDYATTLIAESASGCPPSVGGECALGTDVLEDRHEEFECLAAVVPRFASMLLAPERYPDAPDIPTPHSYAEAITGTYVDEVPPPGANIVDGMWIFRRDYELHSLHFSTTFLQGSLHEEIWLRRPCGFTESFPAGTKWSLRRPVYGLRQAPCEWHDTLRTTLAALGFAPSTADPSLFLRTDTSLPPFYVLVYVDDLVFATTDTEALALVKSELQKRDTCTDLGELRSYLGLQITRERARCTITLTQSHMVHQVLQRFGFQFYSPQFTPLSASHSLSAPSLDGSVEPSGPYPELVGCLMYLMTCTRPDLAYPLSLLARYVAPGRHRKVHWDAAKRVLRYLCSTSGMGLVLGGRGPVVLIGHADASCVDDSATQRSSQGYTFSLGSGSVL
ncbi:unnamed protein product, partial [Closterium sp. NIES-53]